MTNHPFSYGWRFEDYQVLEVAEWPQGEIGWVVITPGYKDKLRLVGNNCEQIMKPKSNWPHEEHEDILPPGKYKNYPRYYVKKRKASGDRTQYIASRSPIVRGLDEQNVRLDPDPVNANEDPNKFKDLKGRIQIADIFCDSSTITEARVNNGNSMKLVKECGILETLTRFCMTDSQVTPTSNDPKPLIAETFDAAVPSIDAQERDNTKKFVQDNCGRFFRIESPIKNSGPASKDLWKVKMKQFTRGANVAGYKTLFLLDRGVGEKGEEVWVWKYINSPELEAKEQDGNKETGYEELWFMNLYLWPNNNKRYWYFCCHKDNTNCFVG